MNVFLRFPIYSHLDKGLSAWWAWLNYLRGVADASGKQIVEGIDFHSVEQHYSRWGPDRARNEIAAEFMASDATHLWMIDSDVVPPKNLDLLQATRQRDLPIVCGVYDGYNDSEGQQVGFPLVYKNVSAESWRVVHRHEWPKEALFRADAAGTGCMLIRREVFERTGPDPWFYLEKDTQGRRIGEDLVFCRDAGGCYVLQTYQCEHYREMPLSVIRGFTDTVTIATQRVAQLEQRVKSLAEAIHPELVVPPAKKSHGVFKQGGPFFG